MGWRQNLGLGSRILSYLGISIIVDLMCQPDQATDRPRCLTKHHPGVFEAVSEWNKHLSQWSEECRPVWGLLPSFPEPWAELKGKGSTCTMLNWSWHLPSSGLWFRFGPLYLIALAFSLEPADHGNWSSRWCKAALYKSLYVFIPYMTNC